jgi:hypothetical protein
MRLRYSHACSDTDTAIIVVDGIDTAITAGVDIVVDDDMTI